MERVEREPAGPGGNMLRVIAVLRPEIRALGEYFLKVTRYKKCKGNSIVNEE